MRARRGRMGRTRPGWVVALGWLVLMLVSLSVVTWRQTLSLELEREVRELERVHSLAEAERVETSRRIEQLRSRSRVVQVARERLGMHLPGDHEIVFLPLRSTSAEVRP